MMRTLFISGFLLFTGLFVRGAPDTLIVMTFNIRYDNPSDGVYSWKERREMVYDVIQKSRPHIIGLQEVLQRQEDDLLMELPGYRSFGAGRDDGADKGEHALVLYDTSRFQKIDGSTFWLSETPAGAGSISWGAACTRIVTWIRLKDLISGETITFFNTHFDHISKKARIRSARLLMDSISAISGGGFVILTGDFNARSSEKTYRIITQNAGVKLKDSGSIPDIRISGPDCSFIGFPAAFTKGYIIDFIFLPDDENYRVLEHSLIDFNIDGHYPSDHLPVLVKILNLRK